MAHTTSPSLALWYHKEQLKGSSTLTEDRQVWKVCRNSSRWTKTKKGCLEGEDNGLKVQREVLNESTGPHGNKGDK